MTPLYIKRSSLVKMPKCRKPNPVKLMDRTFEIRTKTSGYQTVSDNRNRLGIELNLKMSKALYIQCV